jgi:hypothetical protein
VGAGLCIGIGGVRVDRAIVDATLEAVAPHAIEAALLAAGKAAEANADVRTALERDLDAARYEASLAGRRHELVDPAKRHVARELEARWNAALDRVDAIERRIAALGRDAAARPPADREALLRLAHDLPAAWNAPTADARTKQRLVHLLIQEVVVDLDDQTNEAVLLVHWAGGRHTEIRVARVKTGRYPADRTRCSVEAVRRLAPEWPDRDVAIALNRMQCRSADGETWTTVKVRELRERLGLPEYDPATRHATTVSVQKAAQILGICVGSVQRLIREGILPAEQAMHSAPWKVPADALTSEAVIAGVQAIKFRRPRNAQHFQDDDIIRLPGL